MLIYTVLALLIYSSWYWPGSITGALLALCSALLLAYQSTNKKLSLTKSYFCGAIVNILGFYWLADTIQIFGGFPASFSWAIFTFFVAVSSLQFLAFAWIYNRLPEKLTFLKLALAWISAEFLCPRIFPWELSSPLTAIPFLTQIADIAGSYFITFTLLTCCSLLFLIIQKGPIAHRSINIALLAVLLIFWTGYGFYRIKQFSPTSSDQNSLKLAIIQANVAVVQQGDMATIKQNKQRYLELSKQVTAGTDLIIWPEAILQDWIHVDTKSIEQDHRIPFFGPESSLLSGALTFETQERIFNSALLISKDGKIASPYHKRILMPFGEYMPFSTIFPWLNSINANLALFTAGKSMSIFEIPHGSSKIKVSPLICYEDLIPRLSRTATNLGAQVLVNISNDAWFGDSAAAIHHNQIASFRAIENRRFLVRSSNNGLTAVINPLGQTVGTIPPRSEGVLEIAVSPNDFESLFTRYFGPWLWWVISLVTVLSAVCRQKTSGGSAS